MSLVHIAPKHRADHPTDMARYGLSSYTAVVDTQPNLLETEAPDLEGYAQCASCNFLDFLDGVNNLSAYDGLAPIRGLFRHLPTLLAALRHEDHEPILEISRRLGAGRCYQLIRRDQPPLPELPAVYVVDDEQALAVPRRAAELAVWLLVQPDSSGPGGLLSRIETLAKRGFERFLIGYYEHAAAVDHWSDFVEQEEFATEWERLVSGTYASGADKLGLLMAYPPCASLQWQTNRPLEALRARLDMQFRQVEDSSSYMCPENVSGYTLTNDMSPFLARTNAFSHLRAIRFDRLIFIL